MAESKGKPVAIKQGTVITKATPTKQAVAEGLAQIKVDQSNVAQVERQTIEEVSRTITVLEGALATWNAAPDKPAELEETFSRYRGLHDALEQWETRALRAQREEEAFDMKVQRLREFVNICYAYS